MISVKNFVNVDINVLSSQLDFEGFKNTLYFANCTVNSPDVIGGNFATLQSLTDFDNKVTGSSAVRRSVQEYFRNGGVSLCIVNPTVFTLEGFKADLYNISKNIDDFYFVCIGDAIAIKAGGYSQSEIFNIADFCSGNGWNEIDLKTLSKVRLCLTTNSSSFVVDNSLLDTLIAVKYSTVEVSGDLVDTALLIGAYFSKVDVNENGALKDYNFTPEVLEGNWFEDISQATFGLLNNNVTNGNYNVIGKVASRILNIGGDYVSPDKVSIALDFGTACIERDLDFTLISKLFGKLSLTLEGQSKLIDAIKTQLNVYVNNGFLERDASFTGEAVKVSYNGRQYNVIETGDTLPLGYKVFFVPINAISAIDKSAKRFPYIYVALQSVHGARVIQVNGGII